MMLAEIGFDMTDPTDVFCDNSAARAWADKSQSMRKAKHIEIRFHFARECVESGQVCGVAITSAENPADIMTKPLQDQKFSKFRSVFGVKDVSSFGTPNQGE